MMMMGGAGETGAAEARRGGILTVGVEYDFGGFDALKGWASGPSGACAINVIEERLFDMDEKGELVPVLGVEAALSGDSLAWTIKLRRGVSFHDGAPFNADAVVHHWSRILNPENRYRHRMFIQPIQSVEKIDDYTVRFNLAHSWAPFKVVI
ncbi:MAG: ABC transporter substrate-binding protein, partial [Desulfobacterales bacterium]|nr:ABC transporter substrate-binding protein [Desulfobacterales bacterium]